MSSSRRGAPRDSARRSAPPFSCGLRDGFDWYEQKPRPQSIRHFISLVILRVSGIELPTTKKSSTVQLTERITLECVIRVRVGVRVGAVANQRNGALVFSQPAKWSIGPPNPRNGRLAATPTRETDGWQRPQPAKRRVGNADSYYDADSYYAIQSKEQIHTPAEHMSSSSSSSNSSSSSSSSSSNSNSNSTSNSNSKSSSNSSSSSSSSTYR